MSKPAAKISPREQMARQVRKENMDSIIQYIGKSLQAEKNPEKKKNITACLAKAKESGIYISSAQTLFATGQKAYIAQNDEFMRKCATLDAQSKSLVFAVCGIAEQMMVGTSAPDKLRLDLPSPTREQMLSVATYTNLEPKIDYTGNTNMHQIFARVRIPASLRAAGLTVEELQKVEAGTRFLVALDTGSEIQTIERSVWDGMSSKGKFYGGVPRTTLLRGATGDVQERTKVQVEIAYFRDSDCKLQMGQWREIEAIYSDRPHEHNLSGRDIYKDFDFFLPQGNGALLMGTNKAAMAWEYLMRSKEINEVALINQWAAAAVAQARPSGAQGRAA